MCDVWYVVCGVWCVSGVVCKRSGTPEKRYIYDNTCIVILSTHIAGKVIVTKLVVTASVIGFVEISVHCTSILDISTPLTLKSVLSIK